MRNEFVLGAVVLVALGSWIAINQKKVDIKDTHYWGHDIIGCLCVVKMDECGMK